MNIPFHLSDLQTFEDLHTTISEMRTSYPTVITFVGSAKTQPPQIQRIIHNYMGQFEPYINETLFIVGGRGEHGSVMDIVIDECHQKEFNTLVIGIDPVFDLGEKIAPERVFAFKNISLRCYALTQLSDIIVVFPGGMGTIQEIIVPIMHRKLDVTLPNTLQGPRAIFITTDQSNPTTEFLTILRDKQFVSDEQSIPLISVTSTNFFKLFEPWMLSE